MDEITKKSLKRVVDNMQKGVQKWAKANLKENELIEIHLTSSERGYTMPRREKKLHYPSVCLRKKPRVIYQAGHDPSPLIDNGGTNILLMFFFFLRPFIHAYYNEGPDRVEFLKVFKSVRVLPEDE